LFVLVSVVVFVFELMVCFVFSVFNCWCIADNITLDC
jgi:hypothetical protein